MLSPEGQKAGEGEKKKGVDASAGKRRGHMAREEGIRITRGGRERGKKNEKPGGEKDLPARGYRRYFGTL